VFIGAQDVSSFEARAGSVATRWGLLRAELVGVK
jgi:hypothetical protein